MSLLSTTPGGAGRLLGLEPADLSGYLSLKGWLRRALDEVRSFWTAKKDHEEYEVLLPGRADFKDYGARVYEVLGTLASYEGRPWTSVLNDVENFSNDVIRIRVSGQGSTDGNIALEAGAKLFEKTRELVLAAACSALQPRAVHPNHKPDTATDYLRGVRLGQTEIGSFVVQVISRVPPELTEADGLFFPELAPVPYERRVTDTLARSLDALDQAVAQGVAADGVQATVNQGVSANLCEALAGMQHEDQKITIQLNWAAARRLRPPRRSEFSFSPASLSYVGVVGQFFRANTSADDFPLEGFVVNLNKRPNARSGTIGVKAKVYDSYRMVFIRLEQTEYKLALQAHKDRSVISCVGDLVRETQKFRLKHPRNFKVLPSEEK